MQDNTFGVKVSNVKLTKHATFNELSADVDGDSVWIRVPVDFPLVQRGEIFIAAALLEAMVRNEPLSIEDGAPIPEKLLANLAELQIIYNCWNSDLSIIDIHVNTDLVEYEPTGVASFYSGGIDSSQTLVSHMDEITHLLYIRGFGEFLQDDEWNACVTQNTAFANSLNKNLLAIDSNIWLFFNKRKISVYFFHGLILGGIAGTLGFKTTYIPSSYTYSDLVPWGSHPLTDPLWSTRQTAIIHDSLQYSRIEKTKIICAIPKILNNLQVCWVYSSHNCGICSKCVRTRLTLDLLEAKTNSIPAISDLKQLNALYPEDDESVTLVKDLMLLAHESDTGTAAIIKTLRKNLRKYQLKVALTDFDRIFLSGIVRKIYRLKPAPWREMRVLLTPKERNDL